ncbi:MAG: hypothetical protein ACOC1F_04470 [Myxococcota bacterium]
MSFLPWGLASFLFGSAFVVCACSSSGDADRADRDAGTGSDAADDTGNDAADDTGSDADDDTGSDAAPDAGAEGDADTGSDAPEDTGSEVDAEPDGGGDPLADLGLVLDASCYCIDCSPQEAATALGLGCRYLRFAVFPWSPDTHDEPFERLETLAAQSAGSAMVEFGIPEFVADVHLGPGVDITAYQGFLNQALTDQLGTSTQLSDAAPFDRCGVCYQCGDVPVVTQDEGWAWHLYMAVRAVDAGALSIYFPQLNHRVSQTADLWRFAALVEAIQQYAKQTVGREVVIGSESLEGYDAGAGLAAHLDFVKRPLDTDVALRDALGYYALDRHGQKVRCLGQDLIETYDALVSSADIDHFHPDAPAGPLCVLEHTREYNAGTYDGPGGHRHPEPLLNSHGIPHMLWELDGCHAIHWNYVGPFDDFRDEHLLSPHLTGSEEYAVWFKTPGDPEVTYGIGNVRRGLSTTVQFLSQPRSVRRAFIGYMADLAEAMSQVDPTTTYHFPQPLKLDQNHTWQVTSGTNVYQQHLVRQCPSDRGFGVALPGVCYWAENCGDLGAIERVLGAPSLDGACGVAADTCAQGIADPGAVADSASEERWICTGLDGGADSPVCSAASGVPAEIEIGPGELLIGPGESVQTKTARLVIQATDGNLVLYHKQSGAALWAVAAQEAADYDPAASGDRDWAVFTQAGELAVVSEAGRVVWSSTTSYGSGDRLVLGSDDTLSLWQGAVLVWSTGGN